MSPFATVSASAPLCLDHVVVPVRDAREARVFYRDRLGLPLVAALSGNDWGGGSSDGGGSFDTGSSGGSDD